MEKIITYENLRNFAYSNDKIVKHPIRGIVLDFFGLGGQFMFDEDTDKGKFYAEHGFIFINPYHEPWAWMNRQAVDFTDEVVDVIFKEYNLDESTPVVASGGSMGGLSALIYTAHSKRTPKACVTNCPVCDLPYHYTERPDLPRTLYGAFGSYEGTLDEAMRKTSPLHLAEAGEMPDVEYTVFHCIRDQLVNIDKHSEPFVKAMKENRRVTYYAMDTRWHCDLEGEMQEKYTAAILAAAE